MAVQLSMPAIGATLSATFILSRTLQWSLNQVLSDPRRLLAANLASGLAWSSFVAAAKPELNGGFSDALLFGVFSQGLWAAMDVSKFLLRRWARRWSPFGSRVESANDNVADPRRRAVVAGRAARRPGPGR